MECVSNSLKSAPSHSRWRDWLELPGLPEVLLTTLTILVYARSLSFGFVYDDSTLFDNPFVLSWKNLARVFSENLSVDHASNFYRPLAGLWQGLVYRVAAANPMAWHFSGILLHILCVVLVFRLACQLLDDRGFAALAAALFAIHPTHVEAVTWISDAADPLLAAVMLLSALALMRWSKSGSAAWWIVSWLLATACCFVKETGVLMPALLLVVAFCVESRVGRPAILMTGLSFLVSSCGFLVLRSQILHGFSHPLSTVGNREMVLTLPAALWFYLSHSVLPAGLSPCYPLAFVSDWRSGAFFVPLLLLTIILAALVRLFMHLSDRRLFWFCTVWALAPLAAPLYLKLFLDFELVHDRYLYIPTIALALALTALIKKISEKSVDRLATNCLVIATAVLIAAATVETISYQGVWQSDMTLFQRAVQVTPGNARMLVNLAITKLQQGNYPEGTALLTRALEIQPDNAFALFDFANAAWKNNDPATAESYLEKAVTLEAHSNWWILLSSAKFNLGKLQEAESAAQQAMAIDPSGRGAHYLVGRVRLAQGDARTAVREFSIELQLNPGDPSAQQGLILAQEQLAQQH